MDVAYCAILGVVLALCAEPIAGVVALPQLLFGITGILVVLWAGLVWWMLQRLRIRLVLCIVMAANIAAALLVALCVVATGTFLAEIAVLAVAFDVAVFACSQALALRTLPSG